MIQLSQFLILLLFGIFIGICLALQKLILYSSSNEIKTKPLPASIFDVFLYLFFCVCFAIFAHITNDGVLRWYMFLTIVGTSIIILKVFYKPLNALKIKTFCIIILINKHIISPIWIKIADSFKRIISPLKYSCNKFKSYIFYCKIMHYHKRKYNIKNKIYRRTLCKRKSKQPSIKP